MNLNLDEKLAACKASSMYEVLKSVENGTLYYDGEKIDLMVFLDDGIIRKLEVENGNNERVELFDVDDIDIEMI